MPEESTLTLHYRCRKMMPKRISTFRRFVCCLDEKLIIRLIRPLSKANGSYDRYANYNPSPLSLQQLTDFGSKSGSQEISYEFLRKELPVRLANIMKEISLLPEKLLKMPSVILVTKWYERSFEELIHFEKMSEAKPTVLTDFTSTLSHIRNRHSNVVETMAQGVMELKDACGIDPSTENRVQYFLDRFYMSRISIRMLINQHTLLFGKVTNEHPCHIGCIDPNCDVSEVVHDAYRDARFLCEQYYLVAPDLAVECIDATCRHVDRSAMSVVYVPSHLYHMLLELFKNAMRATVEFHIDSKTVPEVKVQICKGEEDLCIKMSDVGGGIPRSRLDMLFHYMYSTAPKPSPSDRDSTPLAGYGYGLPLSRLYARYFQGDLLLSSMEGYGCDAHIYLKRLSAEASELLPVYNRTASRVYEADIPVNDWSSPQNWTPACPSPQQQAHQNANHTPNENAGLGDDGHGRRG